MLKKRGAGKALTAATPAPKKSASMGVAIADLKAAGLDVTKAFLRKLRLEGGTAAGFEPSNRVNLQLLIPYLREHAAKNPAPGDAPVTKEAVEIRKLLAQAQKIEFEYQRDCLAKYYVAADVDAFLSETGAAIKNLLRKKLRNEMPPKLEGLRAAEIAAKMDPLIAEIVKLFRFIHPDAGDKR